MWVRGESMDLRDILEVKLTGSPDYLSEGRVGIEN